MNHGPAGEQQTATMRPGPPRAGQVALITGGPAGLGLAIAGALAQAGTDIVLASRSAGRCEHAAAGLAGQTGRAVAGHACDVTDPQSGYITGAVLSVDGGWTAH